MREHLRSLIDHARQEADSRTNGSSQPTTSTITERLGSDAVRLARLAAAMHMTEAARAPETSPIAVASSAKATLDRSQPDTSRRAMTQVLALDCNRGTKSSARGRDFMNAAYAECER